MRLRALRLQHRPICSASTLTSARGFGISCSARLQSANNGSSVAGKNGKSSSRKHADRDVFLSVLSATATKRDAKSYISRFKPESPAFNQNEQGTASSKVQQHVALVKIKAPEILRDDVVEGLCRTISLLDQLGLHSVIVVDVDDGHNALQGVCDSGRELLDAQVDRIVAALQRTSSMPTIRLDSVLGIAPIEQEISAIAPVRSPVEVQYNNVLRRVLAKGTIPVIPPLAYTTDTQHVVRISADEVVLALTREFAGLKPTELGTKTISDLVLDRIIILDPIGGFPSGTRPDQSHIFINLEQEYQDIRTEISNGESKQEPATASNRMSSARETAFSVFGNSNPLSRFTEEEIASPVQSSLVTAPELIPDSQAAAEQHIQNLDLLRNALMLLPPSASALLTTPDAAATLPNDHTIQDSDMDVRTRRPKNPLIFNLLTDKPLVSSSLPTSRLHFSASDTARATFVKHGIPLTLIPDPRVQPWQPPHPSIDPISLEDPRIDLPRLLNLIEDSFDRPLDVGHYLNRTRNRIAGVIVAGEYEGGAILTWETPPGVPDDGSEESRNRMVPYLDKFAVLKRSQGAGGVADILFTAMVRTCFPNGVCWRSRKSNPVNKWYFERSAGTFKLPDSNWTMFWTTEGLVEDRQKFIDYKGVCRNIGASWADSKQPD